MDLTTENVAMSSNIASHPFHTFILMVAFGPWFVFCTDLLRGSHMLLMHSPSFAAHLLLVLAYASSVKAQSVVACANC